MKIDELLLLVTHAIVDSYVMISKSTWFLFNLQEEKLIISRFKIFLNAKLCHQKKLFTFKNDKII